MPEQLDVEENVDGAKENLKTHLNINGFFTHSTHQESVEEEGKQWRTGKARTLAKRSLFFLTT